MLNAVRPPLVLGNFTEDRRALVQQLVNNAVLGFRFKVLKRMLKGWQSETSRRIFYIHTWTTSDPVSWHARDAHLPLRDLLTLNHSLSVRRQL